VISVNAPQAQIARARGHKSAEEVTLVANGPLLAETASRSTRPELRHDKAFLCCWVGVMGAVDDGVDLAVHAIDHLVHDLGRVDCHFAFLGDGEAYADVTRLAQDLGLWDWVTFTGWAERETVGDYLATADIGLQPDPKNARTDLATAVKTMEYMAWGVPVVAFDLEETRRTVGAAGVYVSGNDPLAFAKAIDGLLSDPERRHTMGEIGRQLVRDSLAWEHQQVRYVGVYDRLLGVTPR
jgi:glycosyltransferase involved in cell wall biosynthesis